MRNLRRFLIALLLPLIPWSGQPRWECDCQTFHERWGILGQESPHSHCGCRGGLLTALSRWISGTANNQIPACCRVAPGSATSDNGVHQPKEPGCHPKVVTPSDVLALRYLSASDEATDWMHVHEQAACARIGFPAQLADVCCPHSGVPPTALTNAIRALRI